MTGNYAIQTISQAFSGRIPEQLWRTVGYAKTPRGAYQRYVKEWQWYHPQQNCWTGHVRVMDVDRNEPIQIERWAGPDGPEYQVNYLGR